MIYLPRYVNRIYLYAKNWIGFNTFCSLIVRYFAKKSEFTAKPNNRAHACS